MTISLKLWSLSWVPQLALFTSDTVVITTSHWSSSKGWDWLLPCAIHNVNRCAWVRFTTWAHVHIWPVIRNFWQTNNQSVRLTLQLTRYFHTVFWSLGYIQDVTVLLTYSTFSHLFQASSYATAARSSKGNSEPRTRSFSPKIKEEQSAQEIKTSSGKTFKAKRTTTTKVQF